MNLNVHRYLLGAVRGCRQIERDGLHGDHKLIKSAASYVCTPNTNGGFVIDDEATSRQASGRQRFICSANTWKGDQTLLPQSGVTEGGIQRLGYINTLCRTGRISHTSSNTSTTERTDSFPLSPATTPRIQPPSTSAVPARILCAYEKGR